MTQNEATDRKAYTVAEFAALFGRNRSWAYRQIRLGRVRAVSGYGKLLIPKSEVHRILNEQDQPELPFR